MENQTTTNLTVCDIVLSEDQSNLIKSYSGFLKIVGNLPIGLMGLILNILAMVVLHTPKMWCNFFNRLLTCLAAYDSAYLVCSISEILREHLRLSIQQYLFVTIFYPIRSMAMFCSISTTIALALERYQALTSPAKHQRRQTTQLCRRLFNYMGPVILFSIIYNIPRFFDLHVEEKVTCSNSTATNIINTIVTGDITNCTTQYKIVPTVLRLNYQYVFWYINILNILITCVLPITILIFLNCRIYSSMNKFILRQPSTASVRSTRSKNSETKKTFILLSIVIMFVLCHTMRIVLNIDEFLHLEQITENRRKGCYGVKFSTLVAVPISALLLLFNASANFFLYIYFDKGFKKAIKKTVCSIKNQSQQSNIFEMQTMSVHTTRQHVSIARELSHGNGV